VSTSGPPAPGTFEEPPAELTPHTARGFSTTSPDYDRSVAANLRGARRLVASLPDDEYRRVLDVGCGTGLATMEVLARFPTVSEVVGVDPSDGMLAELREKLASKSGLEIELQNVPAEEMRLEPETFDLAISTMAFHWLPDRRAVATAMAKALKPGGVFAALAPSAGADREFFQIVSELDPPAPVEWLDAERLYIVDPAEFEQVIEGSGLEIEDMWVEERVRRVSPEEFLARMRAVATHVFLRTPGYDQEMLEDAWERTAAGIASRAAAAGAFRYHFNKVFVIARRAA
jgi:ubiquinone/menaquinone biosynthesis C-methylase UbiE